MSAQKKSVKRKAAGSAEPKSKKAKKGMNSNSEDPVTDFKWSNVGEVVKGTSPLLCYTSDTLEGREKAAGFDIDFTVIQTKSGKKFATGVRDWDWWHACVPAKLRELHEDGYRVVFFTNQAGIEKKKVKVDDVTKKIETILKKLAIPVSVFVCTGENQYRKPSTLMWDYWEEHCNQGVKVKRSKCLYVGDAAGRKKNWAPGKPKDFSCSDRKYAANLGIKFQTPEEFFLGKSPAKFDWGSKHPKTYVTKDAPEKKEYHSNVQEMVIMVGAPATGKSTFRKRYLEPHGYVAANRDTLGCLDRCAKVARKAINEGHSVVIDNTSPSKDARKIFHNIAKEAGVQCRCFVMSTPLELAHHLNYVRQVHSNGKNRRVPDIAYNMYKSQFEEPDASEGFKEIVQIKFEYQFEDDQHEEVFKHWT